MSGTISTLKDEIKKLELSKKKEKFKLLSTIILSNLLVAALFSLNGTSSKTPIISPTEKSPKKMLHPEHHMLVLPLKLYFSENKILNNEIPVSLISEEGKVIIKKAYLHELVKAATLETPSEFKIEISSLDLLKVHQKSGEIMVAIPYVAEKKVAIKHLESKYEMHF